MASYTVYENEAVIVSRLYIEQFYFIALQSVLRAGYEKS
jgi:hypothetical protein